MKIKNNSYKTFGSTSASKAVEKENATIKGLNEALVILDNKIDNIIKSFEYYDIVKITQTVNDSSEFAYKFSKLLPFEAMVINSDSFPYNNITYTRGDIVLKTENSVQHIKAQTAGYYYPSQITKEQNSASYTIKYTYSSGAVDSGDLSISVNKDPINTPAQNIMITDINPAQQEPIYGFKVNTNSNNQISIKISNPTHHQSNNKEWYRPFIKCYDGNSEEIICSVTYKFENDNLIISNLPKVVSFVVVK